MERKVFKMNKTITDTSRESYHLLKPKLGEKQKVVFETISKAKRPVNNQEIADYLNKPISYITPRTSELVKRGVVEVAFKEVYPATNRRVCYWKIKNEIHNDSD